MSGHVPTTRSANASHNVEVQILSLLERLQDQNTHNSSLNTPTVPRNMMTEVRTLELWRAVIAECLATVFYVFLVCGSYSPWLGNGTQQNPQLIVAVVAGFAMAILIHSFGQVSGGHLNPAVSLGLVITQRISPLRAGMFILAQLGGGIAGAALLYGATSSGFSGDLGATEISSNVTVWQGFAIEFLLTLVVVFVVFSSYNPYKRSSLGAGSPAVAVGLAYLACTVVGFPLTGASMNPARSLGPAFVMNKWTSHWIYWVAPLLGGATAALIYEYIFNPHRTTKPRKESVDGDSSSVGSDEDAYDDCSKLPARYNYNAVRSHPYDQYRPANTNANSPLGYSVYGPSAGGASMYNTSTYKYDAYGHPKEDIYAGSKSLYTKSPSMPRSTSLTRSQSVYTRPAAPRTENYNRNLTQAQNYCNKSPGSLTGLLQQQPQTQEQYSKNNARHDSVYITNKPGIVKPEPVYGVTMPYNKHQDSGDSSYSTYRGSGSYSSSRSSAAGPPVPPSRSRNDAHTPNSVLSTHSGGYNTPISIASYHSPNPQY